MPGIRCIQAVTIAVALTAFNACAAAQGQGKPARPAATCNRADFRLILDVGHTAESPGAKSARGVGEYEFNLRLATLIHRALLDAGFEQTVLLITEGKARPSLVQRVADANSASADLFLSIHHDSVPAKFLEKWVFEDEELGSSYSYSDRFKGHSIFISLHNRQAVASALFGRLLGLQLKARALVYTPHYTESFMGSRRRILVDAEAGVYRYDQLAVLMRTNMPAVLLEAGSIINRDEELQMSSPERQGLISAAVVEAVDAFCASRRIQSVKRAPAAAKQQLKGRE